MLILVLKGFKKTTESLIAKSREDITSPFCPSNRNKYDRSLNFSNYCEVFDFTLFYSRMIN